MRLDAYGKLALWRSDAVNRKGRRLPEAMERVKGIEPSYAAWEAAVLPLNYTRSA